MYTELLTPTSGIQIAHKRWAQAPLLVCLYAPPSFGQKMQSCAALEALVRRAWASRGTYDGVFRFHGAFPAEPLALGDVRHAVAVCAGNQ
jgi:hypothetical protein